MTDYAYYYMEENKRLKKELATLRAKAKAYDDGDDGWAIYDQMVYSSLLILLSQTHRLGLS